MEASGLGLKLLPIPAEQLTPIVFAESGPAKDAGNDGLKVRTEGWLLDRDLATGKVLAMRRIL